METFHLSLPVRILSFQEKLQNQVFRNLTLKYGFVCLSATPLRYPVFIRYVLSPERINADKHCGFMSALFNLISFFIIYRPLSIGIPQIQQIILLLYARSHRHTSILRNCLYGIS